jgi:hypothetical protein
MKIKQLMASGLAAIAAGSTLAFGAFGAGLADFVTLTGETLDSPVIVIGDSAKAIDTIGGMDVALALGGYVTKDATVAGSSGSASASGTDDILLSTDLNKTYVGSTFAQSRATMTETDLPVLLKTQSFTDKASSTISIAENIALGAQSIAYGKVGDATTPALYTTMGPSYPYTLTANFLGGLDTAQVDTNYKITLFNKEYTFGSTLSNTSIELYSATGAQTLTLTGSGSEETLTIVGSTTPHTVKLNGWNTGGTGVYLLIDGAATSPALWASGSTYTFPGTTTKVYVKEVGVVNTGGAQGGTSTGQVTLFIGTDKLTITNATAVSKNDEAMSGVTATISSSASKINSIVFSVAPSTDTYLTDGGSFTDPLFGSFSFAMNSMSPALDSATRDLVKVAKSGSNKVKLTFTNKAGTTYAVDTYYYSSTESKWKLSPDGTNEFWTTEGNSTNFRISTGDYFVLSTAGNKNSYVFKYNSFDPTTGRKKATFTDFGSNTQYKVYESDPYIRVGSDAFLVEGYSGSSPYNVSVDLDGNGTTSIGASVVKLYTKSGSTVELGPGFVGQSANFTIGEYKLYSIGNSNEPSAGTFLVSGSYASNDVAVATNGTVTTHQVGSTNEYKGLDNFGTYVVSNTDSDAVSIYLPGDRPAPVNVAIGIAPSIVTSGASSGGTFKEAVPVKNPVAKFASEVDTAMKTGKHLVLMGGPCANALSAVALNMSGESGTCYTEFIAAYPTTGVVKVVNDAFATGKNALVIAGTTGANTRKLADDYVIKGTLEYAG